MHVFSILVFFSLSVSQELVGCMMCTSWMLLNGEESATSHRLQIYYNGRVQAFYLYVIE